MTHTLLGCLLDRITRVSHRKALCAGLASTLVVGFGGCAMDSGGVRPVASSRASALPAVTVPGQTVLMQNAPPGVPVAPPGLALEPSTSLEPQTKEASAASDEGRKGVSGDLIEQGRASWYGRRFHGRRTASGEAFDMHELTAAHRTLPFGSRVRVKSLSNGREVVVRINDRGPFTKGRVIDLSHAAMKALGLRGRGVVRVALLRE